MPSGMDGITEREVLIEEIKSVTNGFMELKHVQLETRNTTVVIMKLCMMMIMKMNIGLDVTNGFMEIV